MPRLLILGLAAGIGASSATVPSGGWLTFGGGPARTDEAASIGALTQSWFTPLPGMVTTQPLVIPGKSDQTLYVGTAAGFMYAVAPNGYVRWRVDLGHQYNSCPQIPDGWGITGTPAVDPQSGALYVVDAFGRLHALDSATGNERPGWPITIYNDYQHELDWGASIIVAGSLYVPTGSFCDLSPMEGKLIRIDLTTKRVSSWVSVPLSLGGGGSIFGWGGPAYSTRTGSLYVGTANTFEGGSNTGAGFDQQAGYGEQLVQLSPSLKVVGASKPDLGAFPDNGFVGSPVIVDPPGCGELIAAQTKSGAFIGWSAADLAEGPIWQIQVQPVNTSTPLLTQIAYSSTLKSFFDVTWTSLVRLQIGSDCEPKVVWKRPLGQATLEGSPTVAGNAVWFATSGPHIALVSVDATTGQIVKRIPIGGISFTPPTIVDGAIFTGAVHGFSSQPLPALHGQLASHVVGHQSAADALHRWESREDGVYSTNDGGGHWTRIYPQPAVRVVRTSATAGLISVGSPASACNCATKQLWTIDNGDTWHETDRIARNFEGSGANLYWWDNKTLHEVVKWPSTTGLSSRAVTPLNGRIIDAANIPGGIVALVARRNLPPQLIVSRKTTITTTLPTAAATATVTRSLTVAWPNVTITALDLSNPKPGKDPTVTWRSSNGGVSWAIRR